MADERKSNYPDSNIFSEIIRQNANPAILKNYYQNLAHLGLAVTVWHELCFGVRIMPEGRRKNEIADFLENEVKILPIYEYTLACSELHAQIRANCRKKGKTLGFADSQVASIALANRATLVTRNVTDFKDIDGLNIENWFD